MQWRMQLVWSVLEEDAPQLPVRTPGQVYEYAMKYCYKPSEMGQEIPWLLFLNKASEIYGSVELGKGGMDACVLDKRIVLKAAVDAMAYSVVLVHNHPTGNCLPSRADIEQTAEIRRALSAIGVQLTDHVVIGNNEFYSFSEERKWES